MMGQWCSSVLQRLTNKSSDVRTQSFISFELVECSQKPPILQTFECTIGYFPELDYKNSTADDNMYLSHRT